MSVYSDPESDRDDLHLCQISPHPSTPPSVTPLSGNLPQEQASGDSPSHSQDEDTVLSGLDNVPLPGTLVFSGDPPSLALVHKKRSSKTPQEERTVPSVQDSSDFTPSLSIDAMDPPVLPGLVSTTVHSQRKEGAFKWQEGSTGTRGGH